MKATDLLLSSLNITEDDYSYKGLFILNKGDISIQMDMSDLENEERLDEVKGLFGLEETTTVIRKTLMEMIFEKAHISSVIKEGEDYEENVRRKKTEKLAGSLDMA